jgi:hypothetical protein
VDENAIVDTRSWFITHQGTHTRSAPVRRHPR